MSYAYPVADIRAAEQVLLDAQSEPDELMRQAAHAVALAAEAMCAAEPDLIQKLQATDDRVLLLVGAGGNGGDALYAGAELATGGRGVDAVLLGRDGGVHERALAAFREAGGKVLEGLSYDRVKDYRLAVDGILGMGGSGGLAEEPTRLLALLTEFRVPILAVDVPSGIDADTGAEPEELTTDLTGEALHHYGRRIVPSHVVATATVTFGALRIAHAVSPACGEVLLADIGVSGQPLSDLLLLNSVEHRGDRVLACRAVPADSGFEWPEQLHTLSPYGHSRSMEPGSGDNKYSGGVVGVCAGSAGYPGAAILTTLGAVRATSSMVRYVGEEGREVVRALPEVIISGTVADTGRVQAWVVGPGRGTDDAAADELRELLSRPEPMLIDADGLTLLSQSAQLRTLLRERKADTVLTPHAGEFRRLAEPLKEDIPDPDADRLGAVRALAAALQCTVLLKGRHTVIVAHDHEDSARVIDAGTSWAATPGSGDVLTGMAGAWIAWGSAWVQQERNRHPDSPSDSPALAFASVTTAVQVHGTATALAADTPDGMAPTTSSRIAEAVPQATAKMTNRR